MKKLDMPIFGSESEEAEWWDQHMDEVGENLIEAIQDGTIHRGGPRALLRERRVETAPLTITVSSDDLAKIRKLAADHGEDETVYAGALLHKALEREA